MGVCPPADAAIRTKILIVAVSITSSGEQRAHHALGIKKTKTSDNDENHHRDQRDFARGEFHLFSYYLNSRRRQLRVNKSAQSLIIPARSF